MITSYPQEKHPINNLLALEPKVIDSFIDKYDIDPLTGCWLWNASKTSTGYGQFRFGSQGTSPQKAHRVSYELSVGPIPFGFHLHHQCETTLCVNPNHLLAVTPKEHIADLTPDSVSYIAKRRTQCPQGHPYDEENTGYRVTGKRWCKACNKLACQVKYMKHKAATP